MAKILFFSLLIQLSILNIYACKPDTTVVFVTDDLATKNQITIISSEISPPYIYSDVMNINTALSSSFTVENTEELIYFWTEGGGGVGTCRSTRVNFITKKVYLKYDNIILRDNSNINYKTGYKLIE